MKNKKYVNKEVQVEFGKIKLNSIITFPIKEGPHAAIILLHGSDRSGFENPYYKEHAEKLVESGFAVLRYEGPGWGGVSKNAEFETLEYRTDEAVSLVKYLQSREEIKSDMVGLWGISQGGWICQMSAAACKQVAFIIPVSGPGVTPGEQEVYRVEASGIAEGFSKEAAAKAVMIRQLMVDMVSPNPQFQSINLVLANQIGCGPWDNIIECLYKSGNVDPILEYRLMMKLLHNVKDENWAKFLYLNEILPALDSLAPEEWELAKSQIGAVYEVNPADFLTKVTCPVLAIFGEMDTMVPVDKSVRLYEKYLREAGNQDVTIQVFPEADHFLKVKGEYAPGYFERLISWLKAIDL